MAEHLEAVAEVLKVVAERVKVLAEGLARLAERVKVLVEGLARLAERVKVLAEGLKMVAEGAEAVAAPVAFLAGAPFFAAMMTKRQSLLAGMATGFVLTLLVAVALFYFFIRSS